MKSKLLFSLLVTLLMYSASYASFPVKRTISTSTNTEVNTTLEVVETLATPIAAQKDLVVGVLLWFFLGGLAAHRWYYGKPVIWNIVFILTLGGLGIWWIIDLINMLSGNF
ncbi:TM2 domain-containing protein [Seonamhaeicola sediminis]|uniref:TM2 domain-containing protein n=1 Tax=Seonamhaeicola sediminis TaxID=2528206 RepID=A0A562YAP8_9FLAO|nr:TM2 domain-containing protein [Seonamhaeicola sediminis]TWO31481.1 TM2 domain-containing protein [Seonamhaeicola sediminis]